MTVIEQIDSLMEMVESGRVRATSRSLINVNRFREALNGLKENIPEDIEDALSIIRQKESVIRQAEIEARRIRSYADEEAMVIRQTAEEKSSAAIDAAENQARGMIESSEIHKRAEEKAQETIATAEAEADSKIEAIDAQISQLKDKAETEATLRKQGADEYAREVLFSLEERVAETLGQGRQGIDILDSSSLEVQSR